MAQDKRIAPQVPRAEQDAHGEVVAAASQRVHARSLMTALAACAIVLCAVVAGAGYALGWSFIDGEATQQALVSATSEDAEGSDEESATAANALTCLVYLAGEGWTDDAALGGCVQAVSLALPDGVSGSISYRVDGADSGWGDWASDGEAAGATDGSEGIAGLAVRLSGEAADAYDVWYRVWMDGYGWTGWAQNGWPVGSGSAGAVVEAVEVLLLPAGSAAPGDVTPAVITSAATSSTAAALASGDEDNDDDAGEEATSAEATSDEAEADVEAADVEEEGGEDADVSDTSGTSDTSDAAEDASSQEAGADAAGTSEAETGTAEDAVSSDDAADATDEAESVIVIIVGNDEADDEADADAESATDSEISTQNDAEEAATITVTISIDASRAESSGYSVSVAATTLTLAEGSTVYDALCALGVSVGGTSTYVSSIAGLAEFACGSGSGWMYSVDGVYPNKACGKYELSGGEVIVWVYTCDLGNDL